LTKQWYIHHSPSLRRDRPLYWTL